MNGTQIRRRSDDALLTITFVEPDTYTLSHAGRSHIAHSRAEMLRVVRLWHAGQADRLFA